MTAIAYQLGYSSIHHFSKQFSKVDGKSPTEYAKSITSLLNKDLGNL
jgi:YesN/AraC family two-component response regulator